MPPVTSPSADPAAPTPAERDELRRRCTLVVPGHRGDQPGAELAAIGAWCRDNGWRADLYGSGQLIEGFEGKIATLLGKEAAVFMPSGTMAQQIALRIWCDRANVLHFAMHATAHLELHESRAYAHLHGLRATLLGDAARPTTATDLDGCAERLAALVVELPAREIGGQLPAWDDLAELAARARDRGVRLHMDGARLWEAREAYAPRTHAEICALFDSVYVSFYKGIGALSGAMLAGPAEFVDEARVWRQRHGGKLVQLHPAVASAAMRFDAALARMPGYRARARAFADGLARIPGCVIRPSPPQVNMFHLHCAADATALGLARDSIAREDGLWLANRFVALPTPGMAMTELYVGENLLSADDATVLPAFARLLELARTQPS
jgi:threonine aldolase